MHYHTEVWISNDNNVEEQVKKAMAPYHEGETGFWSWYQIGGRWKGEHVLGYKAEEDFQNQESCRYCSGTGFQRDIDKRCNACNGTGTAVKWPTEWVPHEKDVISIAEISDKLAPYTLILPSKVFHRIIKICEQGPYNKAAFEELYKHIVMHNQPMVDSIISVLVARRDAGEL